MSQTDDSKIDMEHFQEQISACGPDCNCNTTKPGRKRWVLSAIIILFAGALVVRAVMKDDNSPALTHDAAFAVSENKGVTFPDDSGEQAFNGGSRISFATAVADIPGDKEESNPLICGELIGAIGELNARAKDKNGVFVFISGQDVDKARRVNAVVEKAAATLNNRGVKMGIFTLENGSDEYVKFSAQVLPPGVITMVRKGGASAVSGDDITESKLVQAYVSALNTGGGCCPGGTPSSECK